MSVDLADFQAVIDRARPHILEQVEKGDFSGSTGDASIDPEKGNDSCVKGPVTFL